MASANCWVVPGKYEVYVAHCKAGCSQASAIADCYETAQESLFVKDLKQQKQKNNSLTLQVPIPTTAVSNAVGLLRQQAGLLFQTLLESNYSNVALSVDHKTWHPCEFTFYVLGIFKNILNEQKGKNAKYMRLTFCTESYQDAIVDQCEELLAKDVKIHRDREEEQAENLSPRSPHGTHSLKASVKVGYLDETSADVLACTAQYDLDLNKGAASKALLAKAGHQLQQELYQNYPHGLDLGEIAIAKGGHLKCKFVLFGVLSPYQAFYRSSVHEFVSECLKLAEFRGCSTIAFPAVGAGVLNYPLDIVADQMFETVSNFESCGTIKQVTFVILQQDVRAIDVFKEKENFWSRHSTAGISDSRPKAVYAPTTNSIPHASTIHVQHNQSSLDGSNSRNNRDSGPIQIQTHTATGYPLVGSISDSNTLLTAIAMKRTDISGQVVFCMLEMFYPELLQDVSQARCSLRCSERAVELMGDRKAFERFKDTGNHPDIRGLLETIQQCVYKIDRECVAHRLTMESTIYITAREEIEKVCEEYRVLSEYSDKKLELSLYALSKDILFHCAGKIAAIESEHRQSLNANVKDLGASVRRKDNFTSQYKLSGTSSETETSSRVSSLEPIKQKHTGAQGAARLPDITTGARPKMQTSRQFSWSTSVKNLSVFTTHEGIMVKVYCCDILTVPADCIVNAANTRLDHGGGIAKAILKAGGKVIDKEGQAHLKKNGELKIGQAIATGSGNLPFQYLIHAVGPRWSDHKPYTKADVEQCEINIYNAVINSLRLAENKGVKIVALPTISSGIYGCPQEICCVQYGKAVVDYSLLSMNPLEEIHFVDIDRDMVKMMRKFFSKLIPDKTVPNSYNIDVYVKKKSIETDKPGLAKKVLVGDAQGHRDQSDAVTGQRKAQGEGNMQFYPYHQQAKPPGRYIDEFTCCFGPQQYLYVYTADLLNLKDIDMLVCTEDRKGSGTALLAMKIRKMAGQGYGSDKEAAFKTRRGPGDLIVCKGGNSRFKQIAHAILFMKKECRDAEDRQRKVFKIFSDIFEQARKHRCRTIALPLLGTGKGHADPSYYSERFIESLMAYCDFRKESITVHLVNVVQEHTKCAIDVIKPVINTSARKVVKRPNKASDRVVGRKSTAVSGSMSQSVRGNDGSTSDRSKPVHHQNRHSSFMRNGSESIHDGMSNDHRVGNIQSNQEGWRKEACMDLYEVEPTRNQINPGNWSGMPDNEDDTGSSTNFSSLDEHVAGSSISEQEGDDDQCVICMDKMDNPKQLKCGHRFCKDCIEAQFAYKEACPTCGTIIGIITGDQPPGDIRVRQNSREHCTGYEGLGRFEITYTFNSGIQTADHPNPRQPYKGITRTAYLPNNRQGTEICEMLKVAFDRKLVFTIGSSRTTGKEGVITWNDIHHKTDHRPHAQFGYPDDTYLDRVTDELKAKGVTKDDIPSHSQPRR